MSGWIKLHREITRWEWYSDLPTRVVFMHLLLIVNRKSTTYRNQPIPAASKVIGRKQLALETGLSEQQVRTALSNLQSTNDITIQSTKAYSVVTITEWGKWQTEEKNQPTDNQGQEYQPPNNQQSTNNQPRSNPQESNAYREIDNHDQPTDNQQITTEQEVINNNTTADANARARVLDIGEKISKITGWDKNPSWFGSYARIEVWLKAGWDEELDILPTVTQVMAKKTGPPPRNLNYFEPAIADAYATRTKPITEGKPHAKSEYSSGKSYTDRKRAALAGAAADYL